jgi:hypothetical protein
MSAMKLHVPYEQRSGLPSNSGTMRQPDCFIVKGTVVLFVWPMQWVTSFSGGYEASCLADEWRHGCCGE